MSAWLHHGALTGFPLLAIAVMAGLVIANWLTEGGNR